MDSFLLSEFAIGFDSLLHFYKNTGVQHPKIQEAFVAHSEWDNNKAVPYVVQCDTVLAQKMYSDKILKGFTGTNIGFYGPQGRKLRLQAKEPDFNETLASFSYEGMQITNLEMETSAIYCMSKLLGHRAVSMNCILANRSTGRFSEQPIEIMDSLIKYTLEKLTCS